MIEYSLKVNKLLKNYNGKYFIDDYRKIVVINIDDKDYFCATGINFLRKCVEVGAKLEKQHITHEYKPALSEIIGGISRKIKPNSFKLDNSQGYFNKIVDKIYDLINCDKEYLSKQEIKSAIKINRCK